MLDKKFQPYVENLESKFRELEAMTPVTVASLPKSMPKSGVYAFWENGQPLYVGRSNGLKDRLRYHCSKSADDAPFAFRLAREETGLKATYKKKGSRKQLLSDSRFKAAFSGAKIRIRKMDVRFVEETDQIKQTLLEIYVTVMLDTVNKCNDFDTH
jgi:hypothetical protein